MFAHVGAAGFDPDGVVDDAVHDRVGVDSAAEALVPVLLRVLGAEHGRGGVVAAFEELEEHASDAVIGAVEEPFVDHEERERGVLAALVTLPWVVERVGTWRTPF